MAVRYFRRDVVLSFRCVSFDLRERYKIIAFIILMNLKPYTRLTLALVFSVYYRTY